MRAEPHFISGRLEIRIFFDTELEKEIFQSVAGGPARSQIGTLHGERGWLNALVVLEAKKPEDGA